MKRAILFVLIIGSTLILSACSFIADIVIVNNGEDIIEISYEAKRANYRSLTPYLAGVKEFDVNGTKWSEFPQDRYEIDQEKGTVKVRLAPQEVLRIESVDAGRIENNSYEELNLEKLKIEGKASSLEVKGKQVFEQFKPQHKGWVLFGPEYSSYVLYFKG